MKCLFHAATSYHLLEMIAFRLHNYPEAEGVLVINSLYAAQLPNFKDLENIFDRVVSVRGKRDFTPTNQMAQSVLDYYDEIFSGPELRLDSFDEIFVAGAHLPFGQYLAAKKIPFTFFEDAPGLLFEPSVMENNSYSLFHGEPVYIFCSRNGLYDGSCPLIKQRFCNLDAQTKPPIEGMENIRHFSVVDALGELSPEAREQILRIYLDDYPIRVPENSVLILTEHQADLKLMTLDEQYLIYQLFVDYFFPDREVVFKPHPSSMLYLEDLFPGVTVIRQKFPSELIPFVFSSKPAVAATIYSRAVCDLAKYFDRIFVLTHEFELNGEFHYIHRYFVALAVLRKLCGDPRTIPQLGADAVLLEKLAGDGVEFPAFSPEEEWKYLIVGRPEVGTPPESIPAFLAGLPDDRAVIFLNLDNAYPFYEPGQESPWEHLVPLEFRKEQRREEEFYSNCEPETVWIYTKDPQLRKATEEFVMEKELKNAGLAVKMASLTPDQMRIKVLEGIIAAMEERMQALVKENAQLKNPSSKD